ncbi:MAG: ATP-dependent DNA helicase RecG [Anaeromyxobacter sp.]
MPPPTPPGASPAAAAAAVLEGVVRPLRFAVKDDFAGLARLKGFGKLLGDAVARARAAGAPDSAALRRLAAEADGFEALPLEGRKRALSTIAAALAALVPVPAEVQAVARAGRIETRAPAPVAPSPAAGAAAPRPSSPVWEKDHGERPGVLAKPDQPFAPLPEPADPKERAARRRSLSATLESLKFHQATRGNLEERGRRTVADALEFWPRAYQDRTQVRRVADLAPGDEGIVHLTVRGSRTQRMRNGRPLLEVTAADASGALKLVFFNPPTWRLKQFAAGDVLLAWGKVTEGFGGRKQMSQPEVEKVQAGDSASFGRIVPIYPGPADHQHPALRRMMKRLVDEFAPALVDDLPPELRARRGLPGRGLAVKEAHFPSPGTDLLAAAARATPGFRRLAYEELFFLQLALGLRRQGVRAEAGIAFEAGPEALGRATARLPFELTRAQRRVLGEIAKDMGRREPMNRLLQGDVGSGKTAVAFAAMMLAVQSGWQAALMVPTEILAEQHARTLARWLEGTGVQIALVGASARGKGQKEARAAVADGRARIAVGTHALLEDVVGFEKLGLVVVDEQHRFGVLQRARLISKGRRPDVLVMTATPIPRTLALAFYGDLDQSKIDELPPGRTPVETRLFPDSQRRMALEVARKELAAGRQVYVVYPLVEESEKSDLADATSGAEALRRAFPGVEVGLLHGRMKADEKQAVMDRFRAGQTRLLVATTVIEVGVDVPNASVMIVEHAERFGLSQLHQLRGRVGRGAAKSFCLLVAKKAGQEARERLKAMERTQDGFEIARVDLQIRGHGELLGTRQSGQPILDVADLYRDEAILEEAREDAFGLLEADPRLEAPGHRAAREAVETRWRERLSLAQVG